MAERHPARVAEFEAAFRPLRTRPDFEVLELHKFFTTAAIQKTQELIASLDPDILDKREIFKFGRLILQDHPYFSQLHLGLTDRISELVNEEVEPGYSFLSLYNNLGVCELHMDSPFSKWTVDICVGQSSEWPIHISRVVGWPEHLINSPDYSRDRVFHDPENSFRSHTHQPGDALLFSGSSQWHFRDRIPNRGKQNFSHLLFFHYFPKGMLELTKPELWPQLFDVPELAAYVGPCASKIMTDYPGYKNLISERLT